MKLGLQALRSLRLNYKWRGVYVWLTGAPSIPCSPCKGTGTDYGSNGRPIFCRRCMGEGSNPGLKLGWERIRDEPEKVIQEQEAIAEGVMG